MCELFYVFSSRGNLAERGSVSLASMMMLRFTTILLCAAALFFNTGCGRKKVRAVKPPRIGQTETGIASWYGHPYHGRRAANGEVYDMEQLTAAHRTLPFGTWVRVHNLSNDRDVEVRIQDRGPFIKDRIIDLSKAAAREIELLGPGITRVRLTVIEPPLESKRPSPKPPVPATTPDENVPAVETFGVQVGAFSELPRAEQLRARLEAEFGRARIIPRTAARTMYRVVVGEAENAEAGEELLSRLRAEFPDSLLVRIDPGTPAPEQN